MSSGRTYGDIADPAAGAARRLRPARYWLDGWLYRRTHHAQALSRLKHCHEGRPLLVVGNGPSLNHTPLDELAGIPAIGVNKIDLLFPRVRWRPTMVLCMNRHVLSQHAPRFSRLGIPLYLSWQSRWFMRKSELREAGFFLNLCSGEFSTDITRGVGISGTVTYAALQFAYYVGADPVILVGVDHHFTAKGRPHALVRNDGADRDHFDPGYFDRDSRWNLPDLQASEHGYAKARDAFARNGRAVLDATVGGKLAVFDKISIADAIGIAQRR
ncbi:MAG: 6-hydroxymethylpterin diphosphokinase MptE-like protein [Gammaproteobacteria bacterium]